MSNSDALIVPRVDSMATNAFAKLNVLFERVSAVAISLLEALQHDWATKRFERFSDYRLQDVGFQREWDGPIQPLNR